jgi:hypothetical protein
VKEELMRNLFRAILALCALGLAVLGCGRSGSPDPAEPSDQSPGDAPFQAAFRAPGMS